MGHGLTSGESVHLPVVLIGFCVALLWGWLLTYGRPPASLLVTTVVIVQAAIHGALKAHGAMAIESVHADHASGPPAVEQGLLGGSPLAMVAVHVLATVLGVVLLLHLEQRAWAAVRRIGLVFVRLLGASGRRLEPWAEHGWLLGARDVLGTPRWYGAATGCRGPPAGGLRQLSLAGRPGQPLI